ncbi:MAG: hypothetical protein JXA33_23240 [Anaerolineae bacterium]|nr:hypothetical protein [Anaerolineae bacterium]
MGSQRTSKTASCLYMLGFLSGLTFIILCGSSAAYNSLNSTRSEDELADSVAKAPLQNVLPQSGLQTIGDVEILIGRTSKGDEFTVQALDIEPNTQISVKLQDGERVLAAETVPADANGSISVELGPLNETLSLEHIEVIVSSGEAEKRITYVLPLKENVGNAPSMEQSAQSAAPQSAAPTPTLTPTAPPLPVEPTHTVTPVPTLTAAPPPTPISLESFYPNWRAEYYNNTAWVNPPAVTRDDRDIAFNWGENSPAPGAIGQNWFSVRWTRRVILPEGYYNFVLSADDQAEVYMNGQKLLSYVGKSPSVNQASRYVQGFEIIDFEVKYLEYWGNAHIQFYWEPVGTSVEAGVGCCWTAVYYQGANIFGEPVWTESIPGNNLRLLWNIPELPVWQAVGRGNYFSTRITRQIQAPVQPGNYHLCVYVNDVVRLWLDRKQLVYHCDCGERSCLVCRQVYLGNNPPHHLNLEYSHTLGEPFLGFQVVPAKDGEPWIGAFFDNPHLAGPPVAVQTAPEVNFDWRQFAPPDTALFYDQFSVRWQRTLELIHGQYRFHVMVDDGARLRVNGRTLIDQWEVGHAREFTATYDVLGDSETAQLELDYFDNTVMAVIELWWDAPLPTPTPSPTMTPDP